jgi:hypothetical protein
VLGEILSGQETLQVSERADVTETVRAGLVDVSVQRHDTPSTWRFIFNYPGAVPLELLTSTLRCTGASAITPHSILLLPQPVVIVRIVTSYIPSDRPALGRKDHYAFPT